MKYRVRSQYPIELSSGGGKSCRRKSTFSLGSKAILYTHEFLSRQCLHQHYPLTLPQQGRKQRDTTDINQASSMTRQFTNQDPLSIQIPTVQPLNPTH